KEGETPNAALHALRAVILLRTNDSAGGMREAQRALEIDPGNVDAVSLIAVKKVADGDADGALKLLDSLHPDANDETRISLLKIQIYVKIGNRPEAINLLRRVISLNPNEPAYRSRLVQFLMADRRFDEAEKELRGSAVDHPEDSKAGLD